MLFSSCLVSEVPFQILYHLYCVACVALVIGILSRIAGSPKLFTLVYVVITVVSEIFVRPEFHESLDFGLFTFIFSQIASLSVIV